jgi:hypothetical protein
MTSGTPTADICPAPPTLKNVDWSTKLQRRRGTERIARCNGDRREFVDVLRECVDNAAPRCATYVPAELLDFPEPVPNLLLTSSYLRHS